MDQDSLVIEEKDAGADLVKRFHQNIPVEVAFWIKANDEKRWDLCIASGELNEKFFDQGYGEVHRLAREMNNPNLDPYQVRLLRGDDPLALAALKVLRRFPINSPTRIRGEFFDIPNIEMAYIYQKSLMSD